MTQDKDLPITPTPPVKDNITVTARPTNNDLLDDILSPDNIKRGLDLIEKNMSNEHQLKTKEIELKKFDAYTLRLFAMIVILLTFGLMFYVAAYDKPVSLGIVSISPLLAPILYKIIDLKINKK